MDKSTASTANGPTHNSTRHRRGITEIPTNEHANVATEEIVETRRHNFQYGIFRFIWSARGMLKSCPRKPARVKEDNRTANPMIDARQEERSIVWASTFDWTGNLNRKGSMPKGLSFDRLSRGFSIRSDFPK